MILRKICAFLDAWVAVVSNVPLKEYLQGKVNRLMVKSPLGPDSPFTIEISEDRIPHIKGNPRGEIQEIPDDGQEPYDPLTLEKLEQFTTEMGNLDKRIREEEENLQSLKDEEQVILSQTESTEPLRRDKQLALICFVILSVGEIGALTYFLADFFAINASRILTEIRRNPVGGILLLPVAVGVFGLLLLTATKVVKSWREKDFFNCTLFLMILIATGGFLGVLRGLQVAGGEVSSAVIGVCIIITTGVPIAAAVSELWWRQLTQRFDQSQGPLKNIQDQIRESTINLRQLEGLREKSEVKRDNLESSVQTTKQSKVESHNWQVRREIEFLRQVVADLTMYREAYLYWLSRKSKRRKEP